MYKQSNVLYSAIMLTPQLVHHYYLMLVIISH
jgi:hypothetical protein